MALTRSGSNYSIQSNGFGLGHSSHNYKRQECQPRGEAQMEDARTSTSSQRKNRDIPVSIQELVYGSKEAGVETSAKSLDRHNELLSLSEEAHRPKKDRKTSEGVDTHFPQRTSPKDKSLVEKTKHVVRGPKEEVGPRKEQQPSGSSPSLNKQKLASESGKKGQESPKEQSEG
ncbi:hypothetical protein O181_116470 [Austropuccinia psidii MF-1]|uniref:Uncharacterized protein n=1 Tax=Austropuccinia psidii MF-1 TaxID=1389203 RepID=A0A9Q3PXF9_9BASI|nr:hypothetical protein [Austropuccinia psidii MF-1]